MAEGSSGARSRLGRVVEVGIVVVGFVYLAVACMSSVRAGTWFGGLLSSTRWRILGQVLHVSNQQNRGACPLSFDMVDFDPAWRACGAGGPSIVGGARRSCCKALRAVDSEAGYVQPKAFAQVFFSRSLQTACQREVELILISKIKDPHLNLHNECPAYFLEWRLSFFLDNANGSLCPSSLPEQLDSALDGSRCHGDDSSNCKDCLLGLLNASMVLAKGHGASEKNACMKKLSARLMERDPASTVTRATIQGCLEASQGASEVRLHSAKMLLARGPSVGTSAHDANVMLSIKDKIWRGKNEQQTMNWSSSSYCYWDGVGCDERARVVNVTLAGYNLTGKIPDEFGDLDSLKYLHLSENIFEGEIPHTFKRLTSMAALLLQGNQLSGSIPIGLQDLGNLRILNLSNNNFEGEVPAGLVQRSKNDGLILSCDGNPQLCQASGGLKGVKTCETTRWKSWYTVVIALLTTLLLLLVAAILVFFIRWNKKETYHIMQGHMPRRRDSRLLGTGNNPSYSESSGRAVQLTFRELRIATREFNPANTIGSGMHGVTFKGKMRNGSTVAVKRYSIQSSAQAASSRDFKKEMELYAKFRHHNLVHMVGYCASSEERIVVYEYFPQRSLYDHLQGRRRPILTWRARLEILIGAGRALSYMHRCTPAVAHKNVKSTSIFLLQQGQTGPWIGKLGDFGRKDDGFLPSIGRGDSTIIVPSAPLGYVDPDVTIAGESSVKGDVYCFGVVILEAITGQKAFEQLQDPPDLASRVRAQLEGVTGTIEEMVDSALQEQSFSRRGLRLLGHLASKCIAVQGSQRPEIREVVRTMQKILKLEPVPVYFSGQASRDSNTQSPYTPAISPMVSPAPSPIPSPAMSPHRNPQRPSPARSPNRSRNRRRGSSRPRTPARQGIHTPPGATVDEWNRRQASLGEHDQFNNFRDGNERYHGPPLGLGHYSGPPLGLGGQHNGLPLGVGGQYSGLDMLGHSPIDGQAVILGPSMPGDGAHPFMQSPMGSNFQEGIALADFPAELNGLTAFDDVTVNIPMRVVSPR